MPPKRSVTSRTDSNVATDAGAYCATQPRARYGSRGADSAASPIATARSAAATPTNAAVTSRGFDVRATIRPRRS